MRLLFVLLVLPFGLHAQDYFADRNATGTPILFGRGDSSAALFSASGNLGDNSVKVNFFKQYWINAGTYKYDRLPRVKNYLGWGIYGKVATVNGLGTLFSSGDFSPTFNTGAYLSFSQKTWTKSPTGTVYGNWAVILAGNFTTCDYNIYSPARSFNHQLTDTAFHALGVSLSFVDYIYKGKDDLYIGGSVALRRLNNYPFLGKVTIKNDTSYNGAGGTRTITAINSNGDTYGVGPYIQFTDVNIRLNLSWVPAALQHNFAFIVYPSMELSKAYTPIYNVGTSIAWLKTGSPSTSLAAVFFEWDDLNNSYGSSYTFLKRSFRAGVSTTLNILTGTLK